MSTDNSDRVAAHAALRASPPYQGALRDLTALTTGFVHAIHVAWIASTRDPSTKECLFWRFIDDLLASAVGIARLVHEGIDRPARRELRFMLELVIRNLYVDTQFARRTTALSARMAYVEHKLGSEDVKLLAEMPPGFYLADPEGFKEETRRLYGELSSYTHPTHDQLARRLDEAERGVYVGFETELEVEGFNELLRRAYDFLLVFVFEALGPASTGDVYIHNLDALPDWPFHKTKYVPEISRASTTRSNGRAEKRIRRGCRLTAQHLMEVQNVAQRDSILELPLARRAGRTSS